MDFASEPVLAALCGAVGGIVLGLAARVGRFCTLGSIEDARYGANTGRARMWALTICVSIIGVNTLGLLGRFDVTHSLYYIAPFNPFMAILGGLLFGFGMAMAGSCGFGALARLGGGDLRSFVIVLVMGISAYVTLSGPLARMRVIATEASNISIDLNSYPEIFSRLSGLSPQFIGILIGTVGAFFVLRQAEFRNNFSQVFWSISAGLAIIFGWWGTYAINQAGFEGLPVVSHTYTAPVGESIIYAMTSSGGGLSFGVGSVFGVWLGAFAGSLYKGHFRLEACDDPRELQRQIMGGMMMGVGGVLALGCTVGQGMSAMSTLSLSAPFSLFSIIVGAVFGLRYLITGRLTRGV